MRKYTIKDKNGNAFEEDKIKWKDFENNISELSLNNNGQIISLPKNMEKYYQAKTASADLNGSNIQIESRYIGLKLGNNIVRIRVDEKTNNISLEITPI